MDVSLFGADTMWRRSIPFLLGMVVTCACHPPPGSFKSGSWRYKWVGEIGVTVGKVVMLEGRLNPRQPVPKGVLFDYEIAAVEIGGVEITPSMARLSKDATFSIWVNEVSFREASSRPSTVSLPVRSPPDSVPGRLLLDDGKGARVWIAGEFAKGPDDRTELEKNQPPK